MRANWNARQLLQKMQQLRLIAESRPDEKDVLTRVVVNLINRKNP